MAGLEAPEASLGAFHLVRGLALTWGCVWGGVRWASSGVYVWEEVALTWGGGEGGRLHLACVCVCVCVRQAGLTWHVCVGTWASPGLGGR